MLRKHSKEGNIYVQMQPDQLLDWSQSKKVLDAVEATLNRCKGCGLYPHRPQDAPELCRSCLIKRGYTSQDRPCRSCDRYPYLEGVVCESCTQRQEQLGAFHQALFYSSSSTSAPSSPSSPSSSSVSIREQKTANAADMMQQVANGALSHCWMSAELTLCEVDVVNQRFKVKMWLNLFWECAELNQVDEGGDLEDRYYNLPLNKDGNSMFKNGNAEVHVSQFSRCGPKHIKWTLQLTAELSEVLELQRFPFDRQFLTCRLNIRSHWRLLEEPFDAVPDKYAFRTLLNSKLDASVAGWKHYPPLVLLSPGSVVGSCNFVIRVERLSLHYLCNIYLPIFVIVSAASLSFYVESLADRTSVVLTLLLTLVAFKFVLSAELPVVNYLTAMDAYILSGYCLLALAMIENLVATELMRHSEEAKGEHLDFIAVIAYMSFWLFLHAVLVLGSYFGWFHYSWKRVQNAQRDQKLHQIFLACNKCEIVK